MSLATVVFGFGVVSLLAACAMAVLALRCYLREGVRAAMSELAGPSHGEGGRGKRPVGATVEHRHLPAGRAQASDGDPPQVLAVAARAVLDGRGSEAQRFAVPALQEAATQVEVRGPRSSVRPVDVATADNAVTRLGERRLKGTTGSVEVAQPGAQHPQGPIKSVEVATPEDAITQVEVQHSDGTVDATAPGEAITRLEVHESRGSGRSVATPSLGDAITQLDPASALEASTRLEPTMTRRRGNHAVDGKERRYG